MAGRSRGRPPLHYKAVHHRPKDDRDLAVTWPLLEPDARAWLVAVVRRLHPHHPWPERMV